jgi:ATP-dependent DNA helicase RecQ
MQTPSYPNQQQVLLDVFGYDQFRGNQAAIIAHVLDGQDALVLMPTGGGKSLCYQVPAIVRHRAGLGVTVVVSPLIALMHDQVGALTEVGVPAAFLNSSQDSATANQVEQDLMDGRLVLLYVAPERLKQPRFLTQLHTLHQRRQLSLFAIDEAHCVSQWGHDFREDYLTLHTLHSTFPTVPRVALTATADRFTRQDMAERLDMPHAQWFISSFDRPNIHYAIVEKQNPRQQLLQFIRRHHAQHAGIVYCQSRKKVESLAEWLNTVGINALPYHAGLSTDVRQRHQNRFLREDALVMVATVAFGMGIDKPDVRFVAHVDLPKNIESYYQEVGRAGRDGLPSQAWMAYGVTDVINQKRMIQDSPANSAFKQLQCDKLDALLSMAETHECRRVHLLRYFDEPSDPCGNCDNCMHTPITVNATEAAQKALSCIFRVQEKSGCSFGVNHIIDILLGKQTDKVVQYGHQTLKTFAIGQDLPEDQWRVLLRQLLSKGYIKADGPFNTLALTGTARQVLTGDTSVYLKKQAASPDEKPPKPYATSPGKPPLPAVQALDNAGKARFDALKAWRQDIAKQHDMPAFIIFHDVTLMAIAHQNPGNLTALAGISGIGQKKLSAYGNAIIEQLKLIQYQSEQVD